MTKKFPVNEEISIKEISNSFVIKKENGIKGRILFIGRSESQSYVLYDHDDMIFDVIEKNRNGHMSFYPHSVKFIPNKEINSITIDIC